MEVFELVRSQLIVASSGDIIGVRLEAIVAAMELLGVEEKLVTARKVLAFSSELYKRN